MNGDNSEICVGSGVVDTLMQQTVGGPRLNVQKAITGGIPTTELTADDWLESIHVTGGEICLQFEDIEQEKRWYVTIDQNGEYHGVAAGGSPAWESTPLAVKSDLETPHFQIGLIHRDETPFKMVLTVEDVAEDADSNTTSSKPGQSRQTSTDDGVVNHVTVYHQLKDTETRPQDDRFIAPGKHLDDRHKLAEEGDRQRFIPIARPIAVIDVGAGVTPENISQWAMSDAGQAVLAPYFDEINPDPPTLPDTEEYTKNI